MWSINFLKKNYKEINQMTVLILILSILVKVEAETTHLEVKRKKVDTATVFAELITPNFENVIGFVSTEYPKDILDLQQKSSVNFPEENFDHNYGILTTEPLQPGKTLRIGINVRNPKLEYVPIIGQHGIRRDETGKGREADRLEINTLNAHDKIFLPSKLIVSDENRLLGLHDESNQCITTCKEWEWMCPISCVCIPKKSRCDKISNCENDDDEKDCDTYYEGVAKYAADCEASGLHIMCPKTYRCIAKIWLCDGDDDCGDYGDETHCGMHINCTEDQFECQNGFCIQKSWICDGDNDCKDYSDEINCNALPCTSEHFQCEDGSCVSLSFECDGDRDCFDGSDEVNCHSPVMSCPEGEFKCRSGKSITGSLDGRCMPKRFQCDGDNDCGDWSDEENCPKKATTCTASEYKCIDGTCISMRWKCDGEQDCDGGEDEKNCGNYTKSSPQPCSPDEYTCRNGRCILNTWLCDGYPDCSRGEDEIDCQLHCDVGQLLCPPTKNVTNIKVCVRQKHICDGYSDCPNGADELDCPTVVPCTAHLQCEQICMKLGENYQCACRSGFILSANRKNCTDINECQYLNNRVCSQKCENTYGSFTCSCESGYILRPDLRTCKALGGAIQLLVANRWDIRKVTLNSNRYLSIVKGLHNAIALDYHFDKGLLFWSDVSTDVIKMMHLNESSQKDVIKWGLESPGGIAVDWIHNLLFWTDSGTRRVEVSNFDGDLRTVIAVNELDKPRAIAVHPGEALVFWSDWGPNPKIERSYMDGSERKVIVSKGITWPNGLTIDYIGNKIYWADAKQHVIECSNFDGLERVKVLNNHLPHPFALTIFEDTLYWTDWNSKSISAANKITGKAFRIVHGDFHFPMDIHAFHSARQPIFIDKCKTDHLGFKGGCSHLCLPKKNSRRCACPIGLSLKSDLKICSSIPDKLILVARRKEIRLRQLKSENNDTLTDMIVPLDGLKSTVALDWCSKKDIIFWTDVERSTINKAYLNGSNQEVIISTNLVSPAGLALDWITDKIYWTDPGTNRIEVATINGMHRSLLIWKNLEKPRDIVINPLDGLMFWSDWGTRPMIERAEMDGSNRRVLITSNLKWPNGLAVDQDNQKLYFVDGGTRTLEYMNYDGSERTAIITEGLTHPFGLDVNGNTIFWTDWEENSVQLADKKTGGNRKTIISNISELMDIRVFHRQRRHAQNPCDLSNGGCSHLCLLKRAKYSCACPIGVKLKRDLKSCEEGPSNFIIFAHRIDIRQVSLDIEYLIDVVLPLPAITNAVAIDVDVTTGFIFWSDTISDVIMSSSADGNHIHQVIGDSLDSVDGIIVDSIGRKLYWTDAGRHTVEVSNLDGSHRHLIAWDELETPRGIALSYEKGILFWSDWGHYPKIERSNMDGEQRKKIVTANLGWPNGLSIDRQYNRLYWADAQSKHIESCDFDGNKRNVFISSLSHPYAIAVTHDYIYWTDWKSKALHRADKNFNSKYINISQNMEGLMDIKVISQNNVLPINVCAERNGECSHLCLRNPKGYSCKCPTGLKMIKGSSKICQTMPENFLLIALRSGIGMISLDTPDLMEVVLPIYGIHGAVVLDFHYDKSILFFADVNLDVIRSVNLLNVSDTKTIVYKNLLTPNGIAVDWLANNIYWSDTDRKIIEVARLDGSSRKTIISEYLKDPRSLILYLKRGFLFWTDWGSPPRIERSLLDGTNRSAIITENLGYPTGLAIDYEIRRLLWVDALQDRIELADFNGNKRTVLIKHATHPFGLTLMDSSIYWTDWYNKSVFRATKSVNGYRNIIELRHSLSGALDIRAASRNRQPIEWNQCVHENGGCSHLCFFKGLDYTCGCPDIPDNRKCNAAPSIIVPNIFKELTEYVDETTSEISLSNKNKDFSSNQDIIIIWCLIFSILFIIVMIVIIVLVINTKTKRNTRISRGSGRSVLTFTNPNYSIGDAAPLSTKNNIWRRFKFDRSQEKAFEEKCLNTETTSTFSVRPSSPISSTSRNNIGLSTIT